MFGGKKLSEKLAWSAGFLLGIYVARRLRNRNPKLGNRADRKPRRFAKYRVRA